MMFNLMKEADNTQDIFRHLQEWDFRSARPHSYSLTSKVLLSGNMYFPSLSTPAMIASVCKLLLIP